MATSSKMTNRERDRESDIESKKTGNESTDSSPIPGHQDVNQFTQKCLQYILQATKKSNDLPLAGDDFDYFSSFSRFQDLMNVEGQRILHIIQNILLYENVRGDRSVTSDAIDIDEKFDYLTDCKRIQNILRYENVRGDRSVTSDAIDIDDKFDYLTDANDQILERISNSLDEASGIRKEEKLIVVSTNKPGSTASWNKQNTAKSRNYRLFTARNIERPQLKFTHSVKNDNLPFCPKIRDKPNAILSLQDSMRLPAHITEDSLASETFQYPHPYQAELDKFEPRLSQLEATSPQMPPKCTESPPVKIVDTPSQLSSTIEDLSKETIIAVDLEHHSYRSFLGFTCLMQISTQHQDYIIDAIKLRADMCRLNHVFTNPDILKVFHGADSDIDWLQRDFGLYVVNMFDTGIAARLLNFSRLSLGFLLEKYCGVYANKQYQLADWRIRPLPEELITYAREDTHYLIYIQQCLTNELIELSNAQDNMIMTLYRRSTQLCLKKYQKPYFSDKSYLELYRKSRKVFNPQQLYALQHLYTWRDGLARSEDESTGYVLPSHMLLQISEILPRESAGVLACCNPTPPLVRQSLNEIHSIIITARDIALNTQTPQTMKSPEAVILSPTNVSDIINCRHDNTPRHTTPQSMDTDVLDGSLIKKTSDLFSVKTTSFGINITVRDSPILEALSQNFGCLKKSSRDLAASIHASFLSPFEMYLPMTDQNVIRPPRFIPTGDRLTDAPTTSNFVTSTLQSPPWKLKKSGKKRKSEEVNKAKDGGGEVTQADVKPESDGVVSLSQMLPHKKKKKKVDWEGVAAVAVADDDDDIIVDLTNDNSDSVVDLTNENDDDATLESTEIIKQEKATTDENVKREKKNKGAKKKRKSQTEVSEEVTPFDYANVNMEMFSKNPTARKGTFDPNSDKSKRKKGKKGKAFRKDFRSKTFTPKI